MHRFLVLADGGQGGGLTEPIDPLHYIALLYCTASAVHASWLLLSLLVM